MIITFTSFLVQGICHSGKNQRKRQLAMTRWVDLVFNEMDINTLRNFVMPNHAVGIKYFGLFIPNTCQFQ